MILQVYDSAHAMDLTAWRLYLAEQYENGTPLSFLADCEPQTYQLTPEQIDAVFGINTIWSDSGEVTVNYGDVYPISGYVEIKLYRSYTYPNQYAPTFTISTGEAGIVYEGEVDATAGELKETHDLINMNLLQWTLVSDNLWCSIYLSSILKPSSSSVKVDGIASNFPVVSEDELRNNANLMALAVDTDGRVYVRNGSTTTEPIGTFLYPLKTPDEYEVTATEITRYVGENYVWSNCGDVTVEYGQDPNILINPTFFDSSPLLAVKGYGTIGFNGYQINLQNIQMGRTVLYAAETIVDTSPVLGTAAYGFFFRTSKFDMGDVISCGTFTYSVHLIIQESAVITSVIFEEQSGFVANVGSITKISDNLWQCEVDATYQYNIGDITSGTSDSGSVEVDFYVLYGEESVDTGTLTFAYNTEKYSNATQTMQVITRVSSGFTSSSAAWTHNDIVVNSTKSVLGNPTYIDCDLGEAYRVSSGEVISLNNAVNFGSDLPKLATGANTVTKDGTVTELKVKPNWWKV